MMPQSSHTGVPFSATDLAAWIASAVPGEALEYYRGFIAIDVTSGQHRLTDCDRHRLLVLARRAVDAADAGQILLVQRRHGRDDYSYLAIKATPNKGKRP
jgi:hypothetical protein